MRRSMSVARGEDFRGHRRSGRSSMGIQGSERRRRNTNAASSVSSRVSERNPVPGRRAGRSASVGPVRQSRRRGRGRAASMSRGREEDRGTGIRRGHAFGSDEDEEDEDEWESKQEGHHMDGDPVLDLRGGEMHRTMGMGMRRDDFGSRFGSVSQESSPSAAARVELASRALSPQKRLEGALRNRLLRRAGRGIGDAHRDPGVSSEATSVVSWAPSETVSVLSRRSAGHEEIREGAACKETAGGSMRRGAGKHRPGSRPEPDLMDEGEYEIDPVLDSIRGGKRHGRTRPPGMPRQGQGRGTGERVAERDEEEDHQDLSPEGVARQRAARRASTRRRELAMGQAHAARNRVLGKLRGHGQGQGRPPVGIRDRA